MVSNHPRGTVPPIPARPAHRTLEKGRQNPRREDARLLHARTGRRRDVRSVGAVTSIAIGPVRPSPPSRRHPSHFITIPDAVAACDDRTPPRQPLCLTASCQQHPRVLTWTALERATSTPPPSKPLLNAHRTCHDAPPEVRFARTTVYFVALHAMPPHLARTVRHACKLLPPWPLKGEAVPQPQGDNERRSLTRFPPSHDIGTCLNQYLWDLEDQPPLPPRL
jgi:hypothetical protein